ncbi:MAG: response regulator, partial [Comamonadaceae bacterium]
DRAVHRILVVDDHPATRYSTARTLRAAGFPTVEAGSGTEALLLATQGVSAVVLDVHLPDVGGFEVCRTLRNDSGTANLPVVHLSATFVHDEHKVAGLNAGADAYLVHPVEPAVLVATLQALIRARSAEDRLRQSELRFRAIYDQVPNGISLLDWSGRFADVNPAMVAMLGMPRESIIGARLEDLAAAGDARDQARRLVEQATHQPQHDDIDSLWRAEFPLQAASGAQVPVAWTLSPHAEPGLMVAVATDISFRLELEQARQEVLERERAARAMAERHSRTKDDFVAVLSHELRTPLNAISGWVHILQKHGARPELVAKALDSIARSVAAQSRIIADILDVSRVNAGKLRLYPEWVDPLELVRSAIDGLRTDIDARAVQVRVHDAGQATQPAWLDSTRFQQVVWNLVSNAVKFSPTQARVDVTLARSGDELVLSVSDEGKGISAEFLPHLFDRFTQSDAPDNRHHGGLGLGLSIVKRLVELHGGTVVASSEGEGRGATLVARFRLSSSEASAAAPAAGDDTPPQQETAGALLAGLNVLGIEDSRDAAEMLAVVLQEAGAQVRMVGDYDSAFAALDARWPDAVVSDIGLPGRDGYELLRDLRRREAQEGRPRTRCIALTAFARPQDGQRAQESGFDAYLTKPLDAHLLLRTLRGVVED